MLAWTEKTSKSEEASEKWDRSEKKYDYGQYDDAGNKDFTFNEGAYSIFQYLLLPKVKEKIKLGKEVTNTTFDTNSMSVKLHTTSGEIYTANHVIVTPSVGFLKQNHKRLFNPPLPVDKTRTIKEIWFATMEKFIMYYEDPFWSKEFSKNPQFRGYGFLMDKEDEEALAEEMRVILGKEVSCLFFMIERLMQHFQNIFLNL